MIVDYSTQPTPQQMVIAAPNVWAYPPALFVAPTRASGIISVAITGARADAAVTVSKPSVAMTGSRPEVSITGDGG